MKPFIIRCFKLNVNSQYLNDTTDYSPSYSQRITHQTITLQLTQW